MQCPHCRSEFDKKPHSFALGEDTDGSWQVSSTRCPTCDRLIVNLCTKEGCTYPAWPASSNRPRLSDDVPAEFASEYHVASQIIFYSPEASAAISRRLLQRFLAAHVEVGGGGLADQISRAVLNPELPLYLKDALRTYARVAKLDSGYGKNLHPEALTPVEPGEAEWLLDVLQPLFELYFVQPARLLRTQAALEEQVGPLVPREPGDETEVAVDSELVAESEAAPLRSRHGHRGLDESAVSGEPSAAEAPPPAWTTSPARDPSGRSLLNPNPRESGDRHGHRF